MLTEKQIIQTATDTIEMESRSISELAHKLTKSFCEVIDLIANSNGRVVVTGIGKSAIVGQKIVATFNSTGTPALFMHAADAIHGDLGMIQRHDVVICISNSGNSPEIKALVPLLKLGGNKLVGMVGDLSSYLGRESDHVLDTSVEKEACPNNLAPTTSTTAQMVMGDALAVVLISAKNFKSEDFARYHPGGSLGKKLYLKLDELAAQNAKPTVDVNASVSDSIIAITESRLGIVVVEENGKVVGVITDGDLRRMLGEHTDWKDLTARNVMTANPHTLPIHTMAADGASFVNEHKINHLVLTDDGALRGIVHIQDLIREGLI